MSRSMNRKTCLDAAACFGFAVEKNLIAGVGLLNREKDHLVNFLGGRVVTPLQHTNSVSLKIPIKKITLTEKGSKFENKYMKTKEMRLKESRTKMRNQRKTLQR